MRLMLEHNFYALLTFDKNLQHQQNFNKFALVVFVLSGRINSYEELTKLSPKINEYLKEGSLPLGPIIVTPN